MRDPRLLQRLESLYARWQRASFRATDPVSLVWDALPADRPVVALFVSSLALGRADLATAFGARVLERLGTPLTERLADPPAAGWDATLDGLRYRFFSTERLSSFLASIGRVLREHETLERAWQSLDCRGWEAIDAFGDLFHRDGDIGILMPRSSTRSASKRLNLFLRWMVRRDEIDPGLWSALRPSDLWMPVDTHVLQWARAEGLTTRSSADRVACQEITDELRTLSPEDPLRWDFSITREGMKNKGTLAENRSFLTGLPQPRPL